MNKIGILLVCMASLVTAGVHKTLHHMDSQDTELETIGMHQISRMSRDDLFREKFLLDVMQHVQHPLVDVELLQLAQTLITDQNKYIQGIDDKMLHIIELGGNQRLLSKQEIFTITNEDHLRQMIGIYRFLARSRDWDTFQRNLCYLRMHVNGVLLVNSLLLAIRDREDTQNLIVPGIHEILPELYQDEDITRRVQDIDLNLLTTNTETVRPRLLDIIGMNGHVGFFDHNAVGTNRNRIGMMDRSQLWMPWREMRLELAMHKNQGQKSQVVIRNEDKIVLPVEQRLMGDRRMTLLTQDVGLKSLLHGLINDLCLKEGELIDRQKRSQENLVRVGLQQNVGSMLERDRLLNIDDTRPTVNGIPGVRRAGNDNEQKLQGQRRHLKIQDEDTLEHVMNRDRILGRQQVDVDINDRLQTHKNRVTQVNQRLLGRSDLDTTDVNSDRLLHVGRRHNQVDMNTLNQRQEETFQNQQDRLENFLHGGQIRDGRRTIDDERQMNRQHLFSDDIINRRSKVNDEDVLERIIKRNRVIGGQKDFQLDVQGRPNRIVQGNLRSPVRGGFDNSHINQINQLPTTDINSDRLLHINRRHLHQDVKTMDQRRGGVTVQNQQDRLMNIFHGGRVVDGRYNIRQESDLSMDAERLRMQKKRSQSIRDDVAYRRRMDIVNNRQADYRDYKSNTNLEQNRVNIRGYAEGKQQQLDSNLPTTSIDDERLLHASRRRLNSNIGVQNQIMYGNHDTHEREMNVNDNLSGMTMGLQMDRSQRINDVARRVIHDGRRTKESDEGVDTRNRKMDSYRSIIDSERSWNEYLPRGQGAYYDGISQRGQNVWESQRGMEDIGTDRQGRNEELVNQQRMNIGQQSRLINDNLIDDMNMDMGMLQRRIPRSLRTDSMRNNIEMISGGELLLHNLQQLLARINMERISVGLTDVQDNVVSQRMNNPRLIDAGDQRYALRMNDMRLDTRRDRLMVDRINEIEQRLTAVINQEVRRIAAKDDMQVLDQTDIDRVIGDILMGKIQGVGILHILREILLETQDIHGMQSLTDLGVDLQDPILLHLLRRIVRLVDVQRQQQLGSYEHEELALNGVTINDVNVDKLKTYVDVSDADLINVIDTRLLLSKNRSLKKMVVARQQRLNHKDFTIKIDLTSDRNQQVVVRTLLGPRTDAVGRQVQLDEQRRNFMLLDATVADLQVGHNLIKRRSQDIMRTARDTTPYTEIYQRVLMAINGNLDMTMDRVQGQVCGLPHRLLLPRGRTEGLPMQLLVIVTPIHESDSILQQAVLDDTVCGIGIGSLNLDRLPLGFPLDRQIDNVHQLLSLPNLHLKDVLIHHDDKLVKNIL